ncbi:hypothetical protein PM082_022686 [Marasmius tenuissimus]|nr:hypothetical protein PM082_007155 [Marasmius tenuissimus]KAJ8096068.1 hypothetical protein PM082_022686 [Marasmius tenuissimus]
MAAHNATHSVEFVCDKPEDMILLTQHYPANTLRNPEFWALYRQTHRLNIVVYCALHERLCS